MRKLRFPVVVRRRSAPVGAAPIVEKALGAKMVLPERKMRSVEEFMERYPTVKKVIIDGTERPISRPKDKERQKLNYSGKKKRHTRKHIAAVDEKRES